MPRTAYVRGVIAIAAEYAAGAVWYRLAPVPQGMPPSALVSTRVLIAFLLPTTAAVLLWLFHTIESKRPVCVPEPGDCAATERILFRIIVFIGGLHGLVLLLLTEARLVQKWGAHLTFVLVGALLVSVGNLLPTTRPNVLVGIRTARSLRSRRMWMEINRTAGYLSVALGIEMIVASVALHFPQVAEVTLVAYVAAACVLAVRYHSLVRSEQA